MVNHEHECNWAVVTLLLPFAQRHLNLLSLSFMTMAGNTNCVLSLGLLLIEKCMKAMIGAIQLNDRSATQMKDPYLLDLYELHLPAIVTVLLPLYSTRLILDFLDLADLLTEEAAAFAKYGVPANCSTNT
jgi:hypothetical protein